MGETVNFKKNLEERLAFLREQNESIRLKQAGIELKSPDLVDMACSESEMELSLQLHAKNEKAMQEVVRTLDSLDSLSYGICELCGEEIDARRLRALPDAKYCINCQRLLETGAMSA